MQYVYICVMCNVYVRVYAYVRMYICVYVRIYMYVFGCVCWVCSISVVSGTLIISAECRRIHVTFQKF